MASTTPRAPRPSPPLAASLRERGYTGVTGDTPYRPASEQVITGLRQAHETSFHFPDRPRPAGEVIILSVNFDGTHQNGNVLLEGATATNVYRLFESQRQSAGGDANAFYLPGVGAPRVNPSTGVVTGPSNWEALPINAGPAAAQIVDDGYQALGERMRAIRAENPDAQFSINVTAYSRGGAEAVALANRIDQQGIEGIYAPGEARINSMILFDPVNMTMGHLDVAPPTNVDYGLAFVALEEFRVITPAMFVGPGFIVIPVRAGHADTGGGTNPEGISAVTLAISHNFLEAVGVELPPVAEPDWERMFVHYASLDSYGNELWTTLPVRRFEGAGRSDPTVQDVYGPASAPQADGAPPAPATDAAQHPPPPPDEDGWHSVPGTGDHDAVDFTPTFQVPPVESLPDEQRAALDAAAFLGLANTLVALREWDQMDDLGRLTAVVVLYSQLNSASGGAVGNLSGLGPLQGVGACLGLLAALERGDEGLVLLNVIGLTDALGMQGSQQIALALDLGLSAADTIIPGLAFLLALESEDPVSIIASGLSLWAAVAGVSWAGPAALFLGLFASIFSSTPPPAIGEMRAGWSEDGSLALELVREQRGGEAEARALFEQLALGVIDGVAREMPGWAIVPDALPTLTVVRDASGYDRHPFSLSWIDDQGRPQVRFYDAQGRIAHDSDTTREQGDLWTGAQDDLYPEGVNHLNYDFVRLTQRYALVPQWWEQGLREDWVEQAGQGLTPEERLQALRSRPALEDLLLDAQLVEDGHRQALSVIAFGLPDPAQAATEVLAQIDDDAFLERTQWLQAHQAVLGVDLDGDGLLGARELLGANSALLDANDDGRFDARDPVFAALRLWVDVNSDGVSHSGLQDETVGLAAAGITAVVFGPDGVTIEYGDGSVRHGTEQWLTGDLLGVLYAAGTGAAVGISETGEQADGSGRTVFYAANTRQGDEEPASDDALLPPRREVVDAASGRLVPVTAGPSALDRERLDRREVSAEMIRAAGGDVFRGDPGMLTAIALGSAGVAWVAPAWAEDDPPAVPPAAPGVAPDGPNLAPQPEGAAAQAGPVSLPATPYSGQTPEVQAGALGAADAGLPAPQAYPQPRPPGLDAAPRTLDSLPAAGSGASLDPVAAPTPTPTPAPASAPASALAPSPSPSPPPAPRPVQAIGDMVASDEDVALQFNPLLLLANDANPEGARLEIVAVDSPEHGTVEWITLDDGSRQILFTPHDDHTGLAGFRYTVHDGTTTSQGQVQVVLVPVNDAPRVQGERFEGVMETSYTFTADALMANDTDVETPQGLRLVRVGDALNGTVTLSQAGVEFVPADDYFGPASFAYVLADEQGLESSATVHLELAHLNHDPQAQHDSFSVNEDPGVVSMGFDQLLLNDKDRDTLVMGDRLTITAIEADDPAAGRFELDAEGSRVLYHPTPNYHGTTGFSYTVSDGRGGSDQAWASITVHPVNDAPVITERVGPHGERDRYFGSLTATDSDGPQPLIWAVEMNPDLSTLRLDAATGEWELVRDDMRDRNLVFRVSASDGLTRTVYEVSLHAPHYVWESNGIYPVVVDLDNDGLELVGARGGSVWADADGDGQPERIGWVTGNDAVLAWDHDQDGHVSRLDEISFVDYLPGATSDLEGLRAFDGDGNGWLDSADPEWTRFGLVDAQGGFTAITQTPVVAISLQREGDPRQADGNTVLGTSVVRLQDGTATRAGDVVFGVQPDPPVEAPALDADSADITRRALLFIQSVNAAAASHEIALAFVPMQETSLAWPETLFFPETGTAAAPLDARTP